MLEKTEAESVEESLPSNIHTRIEESSGNFSDDNEISEVKFEISVNKIKKSRKPRGVLAE